MTKYLLLCLKLDCLEILVPSVYTQTYQKLKQKWLLSVKLTLQTWHHVGTCDIMCFKAFHFFFPPIYFTSKKIKTNRN